MAIDIKLFNHFSGLNKGIDRTITKGNTAGIDRPLLAIKLLSADNRSSVTAPFNNQSADL